MTANLAFFANHNTGAVIDKGLRRLVLLSLVQSVANLMLWRRADEMLRRVMVETSALAFWASQMALFLYAAAERLGLTGGVSAWGMMAVLMTIYLLASAVASMRRGLH